MFSHFFTGPFLVFHLHIKRNLGFFLLSLGVAQEAHSLDIITVVQTNNHVFRDDGKAETDRFQPLAILLCFLMDLDLGNQRELDDYRTRL